MGLHTEIKDAAEQALNAEGRSLGHVSTGLIIALGAVAATALVAAARPQPVAPGAEPSRHPFARALWPALFSATTLAAVRIWNAPHSPARTRALWAWGGLQGLNLAWMGIRPRNKPMQIAAAGSVALATIAYTRAAAHVDQKAAGIVAPTGFAGLAAVVAEP